MPCEKTSDCPDGRLCGLAGECVTCLSDGDCGAREACKTFECVARCTSDAECAAGGRCGADGLCAQCIGHADCPGVYHCTDDRCKLDVCEAGTSCTPAGDGTRACNAVGDGFDVSVCEAGRSCTTARGEARCSQWLCTPDERTCDRTRRYAELCSSDGFGLSERIDCVATEKTCDAGACVDRVCEPGAVRCVDQKLLRCDEFGAAETSEPCDDGELCDSDSASCVPKACEPGSRRCHGETVERCADDGSALSTEQDCAESGELCWAGGCASRVCVGDFLCQDGNSYACLDNGTRLELSVRCSGDGEQFCDAASGTCEEWACVPGQPTCNGEVATRCANDGSGPLEAGIDCAAQDRLCWAGDCRSTLCSEPFSCIDGDLYQCAAHGTALELEKKCGTDTVCDVELGACRLQKCLPSEPACDGNVATICNADGLGYEGERTDCGPRGEACDAGECRPIICVPDTNYCTDDGSELRRCSSTGTSFALLDTCASFEFCKAGRDSCAPDVCANGTPMCDGNRATHCKDDGSGAAPGGVDCVTSSHACDRGACMPLICAPSRALCQDGDVYLCNELGTATAIYANCLPSEYCAPNAVPPACLLKRCMPKAPACQAERLATCNENGSGYALLGADCAASDQVCDLTLGCSATATDLIAVLGSPTASAPATAHFLVLHALTSRRITELQVAFDAFGPGALAWLAYESTSKFGHYTKLSETTMTTPGGTGFVSSGLLDLEIVADRYYLLGVSTTAPHSVLEVESSAPSVASFGQLLGAYTYELRGTAPVSIEVGGVDITTTGFGLRVTSGRTE